MKFKVSILISALIGFTTLLHAQNYNKVTLADKKVEAYMFADAIELYEKAITKKGADDIYVKIAYCYVRMNDPIKVVESYNKVVDRKSMEPIHHYNYAQALSSIGKFDDAKQWYALYEKEASNDLRAQNKVYALEHLEEYYKDSARYEVEALDIVNTEFSEFAPTFYQDGIVFPSSRVTKHASSRTFKWDNSTFLDLYYSEKNGSSPTDYKEPVLFSNTLNTKFHEGALTFSKTGDKVIFTRNNYNRANKGKSSEGTTLLKLYSAEHSENKDGVHGWHKVNELPFNSKEYYVRDPSGNDNLTVLYFVSNMPGGQGGADIYKATKTDGEWSNPINLGPEINTEGNEGFPYLAKNGRLFFASDGRDGIGGLDIYEAKNENNTWSVHDVGYPINTPMDDFGLILSEDESYGYFSSNRVGGKGSDDIYKFLIKNVMTTVTGEIFVKTMGESDDSKKTLDQATIYVYNKIKNKKIDSLTSDSQGKFNIKLPKGSIYEFRGEKGNLLEDVASVDLTDYTKTEDSQIELLLTKPLIKMLVEVKDKDSQKTLKNSTVYLMNEQTQKVTAFSTDENGLATLSLKPNTTYIMKGTKVKYLSDCISFKTDGASEETMTPERPLTLELFKVSQKFKIENVFFDVNKHDIRPDAAIELDKVVTFIKANPGITVELGSHTDSRGSDAYNKALSEKRAKSSRDYIVSKDVPADAITWQGYGETEITNKCKNGVTCTAELHQENRRTEIKITGIKALSPEEEAELEKNKKGLIPGEDLSDCNDVKLIKANK